MHVMLDHTLIVYCLFPLFLVHSTGKVSNLHSNLHYKHFSTSHTAISLSADLAYCRSGLMNCSTNMCSRFNERVCAVVKIVESIDFDC